MLLSLTLMLMPLIITVDAKMQSFLLCAKGQREIEGIESSQQIDEGSNYSKLLLKA